MCTPCVASHRHWLLIVLRRTSEKEQAVAQVLEAPGGLQSFDRQSAALLA